MAFQNSSLGQTVIGTEDTIKSITRQQIVDYVKNHYSADRMVLVGAGNVDHEELCGFAEKYFNKLPKTSTYNFRSIPDYPYTPSAMSYMDDTSDEIHLAYAMRGPAYSDIDQFPLFIIQSLVGNYDRNVGNQKNLSSKLAELVATEDLAHNYSTFSTSYHHTGLVGAYMKADYNKINDLLYEIVTEYVRIGYDAKDSEVNRAKERVKAAMIMGLDDPTSIAEDIGRQVLEINRRMSPGELFKRIDNVSTADVKRVASKYFVDTDPTYVGIGNCHEFPDYSWVRHWVNDYS